MTGGYVYARRFACQSLNLREDYLADDSVITNRGDIFIGLDWRADLVAFNKGWFLEQRRHGTQIIFVVRDLALLLRPVFPPEMRPKSLASIHTLAEVADGVACATRKSMDELYEWLVTAEVERKQPPLALGFFHLFTELPTTSELQDPSEAFAKLRNRPAFLLDVVLGRHWSRFWPEDAMQKNQK
jgi:hypothetical protein